jgi:LmbE family N-acetylglucosaminyl deacetylase
VEIWTIMCGYPPAGEVSAYAQFQHDQWGFVSSEEATRARREEDKSATEILGAQAVHFDFLDCIYRRGSTGEWLYSDINVAAHLEDTELPRQIAETISARLLPDDVVVAQLGVGSHVDHVLVRQAAELLGRPLLYDIDVPYIFYKLDEFASKSSGMAESTYPITDSGVRSWQDAIFEYKSQFPFLGVAMSTPENAREAIRSYWSEWKGIRLLQLR